MMSFIFCLLVSKCKILFSSFIFHHHVVFVFELVNKVVLTSLIFAYYGYDFVLTDIFSSPEPKAQR